MAVVFVEKFCFEVFFAFLYSNRTIGLRGCLVGSVAVHPSARRARFWFGATGAGASSDGDGEGAAQADVLGRGAEHGAEGAGYQYKRMLRHVPYGAGALVEGQRDSGRGAGLQAELLEAPELQRRLARGGREAKVAVDIRASGRAGRQDTQKRHVHERKHA